MQKFSAIIMGLGKIGSQYDESSHSIDIIASHASAFHYHPSFKLIGGVDRDELACRRFSTSRNCRASPSLETLPRADMIVIATNTESHLESFMKALPHKPRLILLEKPPGATKKEGEIMENLASKYDIDLQVNYFRRFLPETKFIKTMIQCGFFGQISKIECDYSGTLDNIGCHFVDLFHYFFDDLKTDPLLLKADPFAPDFILSTESFPIYFFNVPDGYRKCRFTIYGSKNRLDYEQNGAKIEILNYDTGKIKPVQSHFETAQWYVQNAMAERLDILGRKKAVNEK